MRDHAITGFALLLLVALLMASNHVAARLAFDHGASVATAVLFRSSGTALVVGLLVLGAGCGAGPMRGNGAACCSWACWSACRA